MLVKRPAVWRRGIIMKSIYIFGASEYGKRAYYELKERYRVIHFVDNSKRKQGTEFIDGITVVSP